MSPHPNADGLADVPRSEIGNCMLALSAGIWWQKSMRSLTEFLRWLPGIAPRKAYTMVVQSDLLSRELKSNLCPRSDSYFDLMTVVGPDAAAAILAAYKEGRLPMGRREIVGDAPDAEAYVREAEPLRAEIRERERRKACVNDLGLVREISPIIT